MKLTTCHARELYLYGTPVGERITSVPELVKLTGAGERTIRDHLANWREESLELAENRLNLQPAIALREQAFKDHKRDVDFLRSEVERLKTHLRTLSPADDSYPSLNRALLSTERQWAGMSGIQAAIDAAAAGMKEQERQQVKGEREVKPPAPSPATVGGGVFRKSC